jgi:drug/metabolite transporter (DMT)-like permease
LFIKSMGVSLRIAEPADVKVVGGYVALVIIFGTGWAAISVGVHDVTPFVFGTVRAGLSSLVLTGLVIGRRLPWPRDGRTVVAALAASILFYGIGTAVVYWTEQYLPSGLVAVFGSSAAVWTALLAHFLVRGDRMSVLKIVGIGLGLLGIAILSGFRDATLRPHELIALILLTAWPVGIAAAIIIQVRNLGAGSPLTLTAIGSWGVFAFICPLAIVGWSSGQRHWTLPAVMALVYIALFPGALGQALQLWLTRKVRPTTNAFVQVLVPVVALFVGTVGLGESISARTWTGAALVLGVVTLNITAGRQSPATATSTAPTA